MILGFQHLFAMFGATVLVPLLTGLNPAVAICCAGIGTLIFHLVTKGKVPVFLGSSFAFIGVIVIVATQISGVDPSVEGSCIAGLPSCAAVCGHRHHGGWRAVPDFALVVKLIGVKRVMSIFPPVVTGPDDYGDWTDARLPTAFNNIITAPAAEGVADILWMRWVIALIVVVTMVVISILRRDFSNWCRSSLPSPWDMSVPR